MSAMLRVGLFILVLGTIGCETQTRTVRTVSLPGDDAEPTRAVVEAPADLHDISGFLLRYKVDYGVFPPGLAALREAGIMPASGYPGLPQYAYAPDGLGTLPNGETVVAVDRAVRIEDHLWCVLEIDRPTGHTAALDVRLVPWADLQAAAKRR